MILVAQRPLLAKFPDGLPLRYSRHTLALRTLCIRAICWLAKSPVTGQYPNCRRCCLLFYALVLSCSLVSSYSLLWALERLAQPDPFWRESPCLQLSTEP